MGKKYRREMKQEGRGGRDTQDTGRKGKER
jgi:hypothetical protein